MDEEIARFNRETASDDVYRELADHYYESHDDPIALVRAQTQLEAPWILSEIRRNIGYTAKVLVLGCGPGFLSNELVKAGHNVTAVDFSTTIIKAAAFRDPTHRVSYMQADLYKLPFPSEAYDVVTGMDLLEHLSNPQKFLHEASRVLHPGGLFFFNSHSKNFLSYLISVKGPEWFIKNTPKNRRTYALFSNPKKLELLLDEAAFDMRAVKGIRPAILQKSLWSLFLSHEVASEFRYTWSRSAAISYAGFAKKLREQ
jgi:2-polyprenyl-6-hydroxyphenyl methylase/3-demethylubiquinone-9 3-methyltransferase